MTETDSNDTGVVLDGESRRFVELVNRVGPLDLSLPLREVRDYIEASSATFTGDFVFEGTKENLGIQCLLLSNVPYDIPVTVLRPKSTTGRYNNVMIFFHGGGWVFGSRATHMAVCEMISQMCSCVVVNVEYRLAPENKYPACYEDAENVVRWCLDNKVKLAGNDKALLGVAGDSAGGNIAASVCHLVNSIDYQVLIYAGLTLSSDVIYPSTIKYYDRFFLTAILMKWFRDHFLNSTDEANSELASPLRRKSLHGLPPALFIVAECDPIADQSIEYKKRLDDAGIKTELILLKGVVHGFCGQPGLFKKTNTRMIKYVNRFLAKL